MPGHFLLKNAPREFVKAIVFLLWFYDLTIKTGLITWLSYSHGSKDQLATPRGLEPPTSSVTGWHSNQLNYQAAFFMVGLTGLEPVTPCL